MLSRRFLRIKVVKSLYSHLRSEGTPLRSSEKNLVYSIDKAYELYFQSLALIGDILRYAEQRIEIGLAKQLPTFEELNPNRRFVENRAAQRIAQSTELNDYLATHGLGWNDKPEVIKHLYDKLVASEFYASYMAAPTNSFKSDVALLEDFFIEIVQDDELVEQALEDLSIIWADDLDYALTMVLRTLHAMRENKEEVALLPEFKSEDDLTFARELFCAAAVEYSANLELLDSYTRNWDVERIAFMDNILLATAISELIHFDSIPVKVTMDEFIEIAKYYSTRSSAQFINGILDKMVAELTASGKIAKRGRGLL